MERPGQERHRDGWLQQQRVVQHKTDAGGKISGASL